MEEQLLPNAPFPAPPPFWKHFTSSNVDKLKAVREGDEPTSNAKQDVPPELQYLTPPTPPKASYTAFGEEHNLSPTLPPLPEDIRLVPDTRPDGEPIDHAFYLTKLTRSLLLNFLELTTILADDPSEGPDKVDDVKKLFLNAHHLINMYRPHQAREQLIKMMEERLEEGRREIEACDQMKIRVEAKLDEFAAQKKQRQNLGEDKLTVCGTGNTTELDEEKRMWQIIHALDQG